MAKYTVLFNPYADNGRGEEECRKVKKYYPDDELEFTDLTKIPDLNGFFDSLQKDDILILSGGDGTINRFINSLDEKHLARDILYYGTGTGNDFLFDLGIAKGSKPFLLNPYIINLPTVSVNGITAKFINGIGYGIDGFCCEEGDKLRQKKPRTKINYTAIALKGLFYKYSPTNAKVTADGVTKTYKKVWLSPTMNGRYFGGGIMPTPMQDRLKNETVSTMVFHNWLRFFALCAFPSTFKGEHIKYTDNVDIFTAKEVTVEYDRPTALQIDGETVRNVTSYTVRVCENRISLEDRKKAYEAEQAAARG